MLARREDEMWSMQKHEDREYASAEEREFFERIEHPRPVTQAMRDLVREYGKYLRKD